MASTWLVLCFPYVFAGSCLFSFKKLSSLIKGIRFDKIYNRITRYSCLQYLDERKQLKLIDYLWDFGYVLEQHGVKRRSFPSGHTVHADIITEHNYMLRRLSIAEQKRRKTPANVD